MEYIKKALISRGVTGDELLDALDLLEAIQNVSGVVNDNGYIVLYHATSLENAQKIVSDQAMFGKEDGIFFSTKNNGEITGYGDAVIEVLVPIEKVILDDEFPNELHFRFPAIIGRKYSFKITLQTGSIRKQWV